MSPLPPVWLSRVRRRPAVVIAAGLALASAGIAGETVDSPAAVPTAESLVAAVRDTRASPGFRARARLEYASPGLKEPAVVQLLIRGRRDDRADVVIFQATRPAPMRGRAVVFERTADGGRGGFLFTPPDTAVPLTDDAGAILFFDTPLTLDDLSEDFWRWPAPRLAGEDVVQDRACRIVELRAPPGGTGRYALVKAWIAPDLALPLRIEKFDRDGTRTLTMTAGSVRNSGGRWVAVSRVFETGDGRARTTIEGQDFRDDVDLPPAELTADALRARLRREYEDGRAP